MNKKNYTTHDIAKLMGVVTNTVATWIDEGKIKAFVTPGGHRRVKNEDLLKFFSSHDIPVPEGLGGKLKILIVEDDPQVMESLKEVFLEKKEEVEVFSAANGYDAGETFLDKSPDLVILDIMLPGINGFKVCEKMKSRNKEVKIIAITGYPSPENKKKIMEKGADAFFPKPFKLTELENKINQLLS